MDTPTSTSPDHLCVLVHGLWGNPSHLNFLSTSLREKYPEDRLHILVAKRNAGSFTYDGIDTGGERVAHEIEETLAELARNGHEIKKMSIIGYSLGGLISRYAIGLLFHKGVFQKIKPMNFTTFATPHLGVRTPLRGVYNFIWNVLGARAVSQSGNQLFTTDIFRNTGRPLLAVLADPDSIFMQALAQFEHRTLYANVVNDRTVSYYTAAISKTDPYVQPDEVDINYLPGYEDVILDGENAVSPKAPKTPPALTERLTSATRTVFRRVPITAFLVLFIPIGTTAFIINSAVQSVRSSQRIRLHEEGKGGFDIGGYRIPLMINGVRKEVEDLYENVNNAQEQEYLHEDEEFAQFTAAFHKKPSDPSSDVNSMEEQKTGHAANFPTLALTPDQFAMIQSLNDVGFEKYPVYIHKHRHTHAAIIRRMEKAGFDEGKIVAKHWLNNFHI